MRADWFAIGLGPAELAAGLHPRQSHYRTGRANFGLLFCRHGTDEWMPIIYENRSFTQAASQPDRNPLVGQWWQGCSSGNGRTEYFTMQTKT